MILSGNEAYPTTEWCLILLLVLRFWEDWYLSRLRNTVGQMLLLSVVLIFNLNPALAEEPDVTILVRPTQSEAEIAQVLRSAASAGIPVKLRIENDGLSHGPRPGNEPTMPMTPELVATSMGMQSWEALKAALWRGTLVAFSGLSAMTAMMGMTQNGLSAEGSNLGQAAFAATIAVAIGFICVIALRYTVKHMLLRHVRSSLRRPRRFPGRAAGELASVLTFYLVSQAVINHLLEPNSVALQVSRGITTATVVSFAYFAVANLLFKSAPGRPPLLNIENPSWHFKMLVLHGVITAFVTETLRLAHMLGMNAGPIDGWFLITNTLLTVQKLIWFFIGRAGIKAVFIGGSANLFRKAIGSILPELYMAAALVIWMTGFLLAGTPESARWSFAAATTQVILLVAPIAALGAVGILDDAARDFLRPLEHRSWTAVLASSRVLLSGAVWIASLHLIIALWQPLMLGDAEVVTAWISWLERSSLSILISWAGCILIWRYFASVAPVPDVLIPGQDDEHGRRAATRFSTAIPVARNLAMGAVIALGGLLILKSAGVDIAPLLAGFGVIGLALSFGSQALVKDVVSGVFFIADDAFRIGEYIETGSLKGTVEQITLRSVRLRHHNGPVHTIPFGQISSVTNLSRDWGTIKLELGFDREADIETIRKVAKNVGLAMLSDPELGQEFILPLKMQGIQDLTDSSMVIRFKFTCRPGNPGLIRREAMKRLIYAFRERGLAFASNSVTVRSHGAEGALDPLELGAAAKLRPSSALAV